MSLPLREQESLRAQIADSAKARYDALAQPSIHVGLFFNDQVALRRRDVKQMAQTLADLAMRLMPEPGQRCEEEYNWVNREYFPEVIDVMTVSRPERLQRSIWSVPSAEELPPLLTSDIQARITAKNVRVPDYLRQCDRIWLVLCTCGEGLSSYAELSDEVIGHISGTVHTSVRIQMALDGPRARNTAECIM